MLEIRKKNLMKSQKKEQNRIAVINTTIETLLNERKEITESLTKELVNWLMKKNALLHDYDTLIGGISSVLKIIEKNDDEAIAQKELWKRDGSKLKKAR